MRKWIVTIIIAVGMLGFSQSVNAGFFDWFKSILTSKAVERVAEPILGDASLSEILKYNYTTGLTYLNTRLSQLLIGGTNSTTTNAKLEVGGDIHATGTISFLNEIKPDGDTCSNGQILKKTGTNDWDCATDAGGSGASSWEQVFTNAIRPTNTSAGIFVQGSSTIDNNLRVTGSVNSTSTVTDTLSVKGTTTVDTTTLVVNPNENRVGIGTATPQKALEVYQSTSGNLSAGLYNPNTAGSQSIAFTENGSVNSGYIKKFNSTESTNPSDLLLWNTDNADVTIGVNNRPAVKVFTLNTLNSILGVQGISTGSVGEATMYLNLNQGSGNIQWTDYSHQNYAKDTISAIGIARLGTEPLIPFTIRFWDNNLGGSETAKNVFWADPSGVVAVGNFSSSTSIVNNNPYNPTGAVVQLGASSTAVSQLAVYTKQNTSQPPYFVINTNGGVGIGDNLPFYPFQVSSSTATVTANIIGNAKIEGGATTTNLGVTSLAVVSCDVKATSAGSLYCGTDSIGSPTGFNGSWESVFTNAIRPTNTTSGIFVQASSTVDSDFRVAQHFNVGTTTPFDGVGIAIATTTQISATTTIGSNSLIVRGGDGRVGIGTLSPNTNLVVLNSGTQISLQAPTVALFQRSSAVSSNATVSVISGNQATNSGFLIGDTDSETVGGLQYNHLTNVAMLYANGSAKLTVSNSIATTTGALVVGTTNPTINMQAGDVLAGRATTTNLAVTSVNAANCDVMADTNGSFYCGTNGTGSGGGNGSWESFGTNVLRPTNTSAAILVNAASSTITQLVSNNATISTLNSTSTNIGTLVVYTGSTFPNNDITDAEVSDTLTASDLQAASAVVADSEVVDALTINTSIEAIYTGNIRSNHINATSTNVGTLTGYGLATLPDLRASMLNSSTTNIGTLNVFTQSSLAKATATNFAITTLTAASCDVKSTTNGDLYCGTDATGGSSGSAGAWEAFSANVLRPTNTTAAVLINSASSTITRLNSNGATISDINATTTQVGTLMVYGGATSTNLAVLGMTAANCDVKATTAGTFYCGIDAGGAGSDMNSWEILFTNALTPTSSSAGIFVKASSTFEGTLRVAGSLNASSTVTDTFRLNAENFTDLTGAGLQNAAGVLTLNATGDWTGTFDGLEGTAYAKTGVNGSWETFAANILRPTNTTAAIIVNAATSTITNLKMNNSTTTDFGIFGTSALAAPTNTVSIIGNSFIQGRSTSTATSTVGGLRITDDEGAVQHGVEIIPGATTTLRFY